jgi:hypothetical protein
VIDLSDTDSPQLNNLVIADILRGLQETQEARYQKAKDQDQSVTPVLIIIEEAHEFLSANRIAQMPVLFEQVARIAKRGRKRWLGLVFVTQLPQHLPNEVLGLLNNFIIHKITDSTVISRMQRTVGSIDESLWNRVSRLAPGQALVSFSNFTRPLMVAVDPAPVKRLLVDWRDVPEVGIRRSGQTLTPALSQRERGHSRALTPSRGVGESPSPRWHDF